MAKKKNLAEKVLKFASYIDDNMSRSLKVQEALGKTGTKMLTQLCELADTELGNDVAPQTCDPSEIDNG